MLESVNILESFIVLQVLSGEWGSGFKHKQVVLSKLPYLEGR